MKVGEVYFKRSLRKRSQGYSYYKYEFVHVRALNQRSVRVNQIGYQVTLRTRGPRPLERDVLGQRMMTFKELESNYTKYDALTMSLPSSERIAL